MRSHTRAWKEKELEELKKLIGESEILGIANLERVPASMLQMLRSSLAGKAKIKVSKKRLILKALKGSKHEKLAEYVRNQVALISSSIDPFELYAMFRKNVLRTYAKPGKKATKDIVVPAGDTGLAPGPDLSVLKQAGLPAIMQGGKIVIQKDTVVVKEGEIISEEVASALMKLDIKPEEICLLPSAFSDGKLIYPADVLHIDTDKFREELAGAYRNAFNLAFNAGYITKETLPLLIQKAVLHARALSINAKIFNKYALPYILAEAHSALQALINKLTEVKEVEYVYAALLLHSAGKEIDEKSVSEILKAAGIEVDEAKVKALVASLKEVNIDEAIQQAAVPVAAAPQAAQQAPQQEEKKEEEKKEEEAKSEEEAASGLSALFG